MGATSQREPKNQYPKLLTPKQVAEIRACSVSLLEKERRAGRGIRYIKDGASVRYHISDVVSYIERLPRHEPIK